MKILLPIDGSDYTKRMLSYIAAHDELLGPGHQYLMFTAVAPVPGDAARLLDHATVESYYRNQADEVLRPVKSFADQQGWKVRMAHAAGHATEAIADFASSEKPDLIVMGTHGHSALANMLPAACWPAAGCRCC